MANDDLTVVEKLEKSEAALAQLQTENATLKSQKEAAEAASNFDREMLATLTTERDALKAENGTLKETVENNAKTITRLEGEAATAEDRAAKLVANLGVPQIKVTAPHGKTATATSTDDLWKEYKAITDPKEKTKFFRAHPELSKMK